CAWLHNLGMFPLRIAVSLCAWYEWNTVAIGRRRSNLWRACQILSLLDGAQERRGIIIARQRNISRLINKRFHRRDRAGDCGKDFLAGIGCALGSANGDDAVR